MSEPLPGREPFVHRNNFLDKSVEIWNSDKRFADKILYGVEPQYWSFKNKMYDLSNFIDQHPGGTHWLKMTQGTDITDFVQIHHLDIEKIEEILKIYYVKDCEKKPEFLRFEWLEDSLFNSIRTRILKEFKAKGTSASLLARAQYFLLIFIFLCSFYLLFLTQSPIFAVITGLLCLSMLGIGHNFIHQKPSLFRFCADLTLFGSYQWTISHALSHHTYANLELDIEIDAIEPFIYYLSNKPKNPIINIFLGHILFFFIGIFNYIRRFLFFFLGKDKLQPENIIPFVEFLIIWSNASSFSWALQLWVIMHGCASFHLILATFPNHRTSNHWSEGDPNPVKGYAEHTILTTSDHSCGLPLILAYLLFGGFNDHILHHLLPTIDRSVLLTMKPVLIEECDKFGIDYKESEFIKNFIGVYVGFFRNKPYYKKKEE